MAVGSLLVFLIFVVESFVVTYSLEEPSCGLCSRFEYDNKMLEKMVRIEHQQELLQQTNENQKKRMNELKDQLEHSQQNNEDQKKRMIALEAKLNDIPLKHHVGFHATTVKNQSPNAGETLVFKTIKVNTGSGFDENTGVFTAPFGGMYMFATQICNYGNRGLQFNMYVNAVRMTSTYHREEQQSVCTSANMVADLKTGDRVFVQANEPSFAGQVIFENKHRECMFTGVLVS